MLVFAVLIDGLLLLLLLVVVLLLLVENCSCGSGVVHINRIGRMDRSVERIAGKSAMQLKSVIRTSTIATVFNSLTISPPPDAAGAIY